eukprot:jgi/Bigna1/73794/fgenesh1_pg.26_\
MEEVPIKLVVVGGKGVGKTAIVHRFKKRNFHREYVPTVGFNVNTFQLTKAIQKQSLDICLQIWDVSHLEIDGFHLETIFEDVSGVMIVIDPSDSKSLMAFDDWLNVVRDLVPNTKIPVTLAVTKLDLCKDHTTSTASLIASSIGLTPQSSLAKLFGAGGSTQGEPKKKVSGARGDEKTGSKDGRVLPPSLEELRPREQAKILDKFCALAGLAEWKQCSSKTGKNVKVLSENVANCSEFSVK